MSLIYWWPFTDNTVDKINGKTFTSTNWSFQSGGKIGNCFTPSWTDSNTISRQIYAESVSIPETFSVAVWVKNNNNFNSPRTYCPIQFSNGDCWLTGASNKGWDFSHNSLRLIFNNGSNVSGNAGNAEVNWGYNPREFLGNWYHLAFTVNKTTRKAELFINGVSKGIKNLPTAVDTYGGTFKLKINWVQGWMLDGSLNDLRIYDHALSQAEVKELSKALVVHYTFNDTLSEPTTNYSVPTQWSIYSSYWTLIENTSSGFKIRKTAGSAETTVAFSNGTIYGQMQVGDVWTSSCMLFKNGKPYKTNVGALTNYGLGQTIIDWKSTDDGYYTSTFKITSKSNAYLLHARIFGDTADTNDVYEIRNLQYEKKDHATPYTPTSRESMLVNEAGYSGNGTLYNSSLSTDTASGSLSCHTPRINPENINGNVSATNSAFVYADVFGYNYTPTEFTVAWWWKVVDWGNGVGPFGLVTRSGSYLDSTLGVHNGAIYVNFTGGDTRVSRVFMGGGTNKWTHFAITFAPGSYTSYINGISQGTATTDASLTLDPWRYIYLGAGGAGGVIRDGDIYWGDFRYYNTCLSASDIAELYKTKAYITDQGDIMCGEFIENKTEAGVTEKSIFECNETQEKLNIPGFELLDGILIEKNPYFDTGLVFSDVNTSIYVDAEVTPTNTSGNNCLAGSGNSSWNGPIMLNFCGGKLEFGTSGYSTSTEPQGKFAVNERLTVQAEIYLSTQKWYKNNVPINNITQRTRTATTATFAIGTFKTPSGTVGATHSFKGYIHRFYIKYGDEVRCYLPAKRKADSVYGLYDIHTKTFLVNSGGGSVSGTVSTLCDEAAIYHNGHISGREIIEI